MRATLVNISKEFIELDGENPMAKSYKRVSIQGIIPFKKIRAGETPNYEARADTYLPVKVFNPEIMQEEIYLVRHDQRGMFNDLMEIRNGYLQNALKIVEEKTREKMMKQYEEVAVPALIKSIKVLPFWRRLFNSF